jgi:hypothetical protein
VTDQPDWTTPATQATIAAVSDKLDLVSTQLLEVIANTALLTGPLTQAQVNVGTAATLLRLTVGREGVIIFNNSLTLTVWVGSAGVTVGLGTPVPPQGTTAYGLDGASIYGIVSVGTVVVNVTHSPIG